MLRRCTACIVMLLTALLGACASAPLEQASEPVRNDAQYLPLIASDAAVIAATDSEVLRRLQLVSTNLVSAMVQVPELNPVSVTLQVSEPRTAFGHTVVRALEVAGYGLQLVSADQGRHYVGYSKRIAETEAGEVIDYQLDIGAIKLRREFSEDDKGIFPSSLMYITGTDAITDITIDDEIFREQGGDGDAFLSGVQNAIDLAQRGEISEVQVNPYDETPTAKRTRQEGILMAARQRGLAASSARSSVDLDEYARMRRAVLIFEDTDSQIMGVGNKQAVRLMVREYRDDDIFVITACTDADGSNAAAAARGIRVEEELLSHGVPAPAVYQAPCIRASYRHASDKSPAAVQLVLHRPL